MSINRDIVLEQVMSLPVEDRAFMIAALEKSMAADGMPTDAVEADSSVAVVGSEFASELERRSRVYRNGETTARSAADVLADLRRREASA